MQKQFFSRCLLLFLCLSGLCLKSSNALADTLTVTTTSDSGPGSLRQAILDANATTSGSFIQFNIPTSDAGFNATTGAFIINVNSALPALTASGITIDGTTQTAFTGNTNAAGPEVVLNGSGRLMDGLVINSAGCTIRGLVINGFAGSGTLDTGGIKLTGATASGNRVDGCFLGTDATGMTAVPNFNGVLIVGGGHSNLIGGLTASARNVISGNNNDGVSIGEKGTVGNTVQGNYIGLNVTGKAALPNQQSGVALFVGTQRNVIGGVVAGARNVIGGNKANCVFMGFAGTANNVVQGNYLGTDVSGTVALLGGQYANGVALVDGATNNLIGGSIPGARNLISGNKSTGLYFHGNNTSGNRVQGNYVGLEADGKTALANGAGIYLSGGTHDNVVGGTVAGARNVISGNSHDGLFMTDAGTTHNIAQGNYMGLNAAGTAPLPNTWSGVSIVNGANNNLIGGTIASARNVISGNGGYGIFLGFAGTNTNLVQGNYIGLNPSGTAAFPNVVGVYIDGGAKNNRIGGTVPNARNIIAGNTSNGVLMGSPGTSGNLVQGNYLGLGISGATTLPSSPTSNGVAIIGGASGNVIGGLVPGARNIIGGNNGSGIFITGSNTTANLVQGNYIGIDATGTRIEHNGHGVAINGGAQNNLIGGTTPAARNVISGNAIDGIHISDKGSNANTVQGNYIGTNPVGTTALPNSASGVTIGSGAQANVIGGALPSARNVISGNHQFDIYIDGKGTNNNQIQGNYIGIDPAGTLALSHSSPGIAIGGGAQHNLIGGTTAGLGNVISGHSGSAIILWFDASYNLVQGNFIGTNATGTAALSNRDFGIWITAKAHHNIIGGASVGARNIISRNHDAGIAIVGDGNNYNEVRANIISRNAKDGIRVNNNSIGTTIRSNAIFGNGGLGINLQPNGEPDNTVTPNDPGDTDTGPNNLQNFPVITQVIGNGSTTVINGTFNSTPNSSFDLDFYRNTALDASGYGEGEVYLGTTRTTTNSSGNGSFSVSVAGSFARQFFTVTATNASTGDTSEFSKAVQASVPTAREVAASVMLSTAKLNPVNSSIELVFGNTLESSLATDSDHYLVEVNGQPVAVQSVAYKAQQHRVTLGLEAGCLIADAKVVIRWQDLRDTQGHTGAGQTGPLTAP